MKKIDLKINYVTENIDDNENATDTNSDSESIVNNCHNKSEMVQNAIEYLAGWVAKTFRLKFPELGSTTTKFK